MAEVKSNGLRRVLRARPGAQRKAVAELTARVEELEAAVRETRRHHLRVAELTDIVQELLLPIAQQDRKKVDELLARYSEQLG